MYGRFGRCSRWYFWERVGARYFFFFLFFCNRCLLACQFLLLLTHNHPMHPHPHPPPSDAPPQNLPTRLPLPLKSPPSRTKHTSPPPFPFPLPLPPHSNPNLNSPRMPLAPPVMLHQLFKPLKARLTLLHRAPIPPFLRRCTFDMHGPEMPWHLLVLGEAKYSKPSAMAFAAVDLRWTDVKDTMRKSTAMQ